MDDCCKELETAPNDYPEEAKQYMQKFDGQLASYIHDEFDTQFRAFKSSLANLQSQQHQREVVSRMYLAWLNSIIVPNHPKLISLCQSVPGSGKGLMLVSLGCAIARAHQ